MNLQSRLRALSKSTGTSEKELKLRIRTQLRHKIERTRRTELDQLRDFHSFFPNEFNEQVNSELDQILNEELKKRLPETSDLKNPQTYIDMMLLMEETWQEDSVLPTNPGFDKEEQQAAQQEHFEQEELEDTLRLFSPE